MTSVPKACFERARIWIRKFKERKYSNASEYFNQSVLGYFVSDAVSRRALFEITKLVTIRSSRMKERFYERLVEIPDWSVQAWPPHRRKEQIRKWISGYPTARREALPNFANEGTVRYRQPPRHRSNRSDWRRDVSPLTDHAVWPRVTRQNRRVKLLSRPALRYKRPSNCVIRRYGDFSRNREMEICLICDEWFGL